MTPIAIHVAIIRQKSTMLVIKWRCDVPRDERSRRTVTPIPRTAAKSTTVARAAGIITAALCVRVPQTDPKGKPMAHRVTNSVPKRARYIDINAIVLLIYLYMYVRKYIIVKLNDKLIKPGIFELCTNPVHRDRRSR